MTIEIRVADYRNREQAADLVQLLDSYARDPMGGGTPLDPGVMRDLPARLAATPGAFSVLAHVEGQPAGLINCFMGFSTFRCRPLVNVHDVVVAPAFRGRGLSRLMLERVEAVARERGCCKLTLEVLEGNVVAQQAYRAAGFCGYELGTGAGHALFWQKPLDATA